MRALAADNAELDERDRVTIDSVRNHCQRHFPVQQVAKATYREILEHRAEGERRRLRQRRCHRDHSHCVPLETVMVKSYGDPGRFETPRSM